MGGMGNKRMFLVTMDMPDTTLDQVEGYIEAAVSAWGGQYPIEDPLFTANWDRDSVRVNRIPDNGKGQIFSMHNYEQTIEKLETKIAMMEETLRSDNTGDWVIVVKRDPGKVNNRQTHMVSRSFAEKEYAEAYADLHYRRMHYRIVHVGT